MLLLLSIFVLVFFVSLLLVRYLSPISTRGILSLLCWGFIGGAIGGLIALAPLIALFGPYMLVFPIIHSVFTPLWGMTFALLIQASNGRQSESEIGIREKVILGSLFGFAMGVTLATSYPYFLGHPSSEAHHLEFAATIIWLLLGPFSGAGAGLMSVNFKVDVRA